LGLPSEQNDVTEGGRSHLVAPGAVATRIADLVEPTIADLGYELVRLRLTGEQGGTLQLMAERPDGTMKVEGCEEVSRSVSAILDVEDPIKNQFILEVSSPGIGRPLTRKKDFEIWAGFEAKLELSEALAGRKRFRGNLQGVEGGEILLMLPIEGHDEPQTIGLPFSLVSEARLIMTDELVDESARRSNGVDAETDDGVKTKH
jgi:ribosome maturation factor RimP